MVLHRKVQDRHPAINKKVYADATERTADSDFDAFDVGNFYRQADDDSIWMLTGYSPATWQVVSLAAGVLDGFYVNDGIIRSLISSSGRNWRFEPINFGTLPLGSGSADYAQATDSYIGGLQFSSLTERAEGNFKIFSDWNTSENPVFIGAVTLMTSLNGVIAIEMKFRCKNPYTAMRNNTIVHTSGSYTLPQYTTIHFIKTLDRTVLQFQQTDIVSINMGIHSTSNITNIIVNRGGFAYPSLAVQTEYQYFDGVIS